MFYFVKFMLISIYILLSLLIRYYALFLFTIKMRVKIFNALEFENFNRFFFLKRKIENLYFGKLYNFLKKLYGIV